MHPTPPASFLMPGCGGFSVYSGVQLYHGACSFVPAYQTTHGVLLQFLLGVPDHGHTLLMGWPLVKLHNTQAWACAGFSHAGAVQGPGKPLQHTGNDRHRAQSVQRQVSAGYGVMGSTRQTHMKNRSPPALHPPFISKGLLSTAEQSCCVPWPMLSQESAMLVAQQHGLSVASWPCAQRMMTEPRVSCAGIRARCVVYPVQASVHPAASLQGHPSSAARGT